MPVAPERSGGTPYERVHRDDTDLRWQLRLGFERLSLESPDGLITSVENVRRLQNGLRLGDAEPSCERVDRPGALHLDVHAGKRGDRADTAGGDAYSRLASFDLFGAGPVERHHSGHHAPSHRHRPDVLDVELEERLQRALESVHLLRECSQVVRVALSIHTRMLS